ncbi:serine/threonine-protein kinase [Streptomyces sp. DSM 44917]|uniref:non-specific serine/threonine protein kinase n=1 Tax=Streptomyces boetiae TaxID=3075541 RepID=A0ABU2LEJ7_9ACTN|nr:serine/threonine-protein kinase [Streptomyces sp. DSM 44917]MDT0309697.1 serine/threonine-protein kinase [Streptomyces sp. DSM 44917]
MTGSGTSGDGHAGRPGGPWTVPGYTEVQQLGGGGGGRVVIAVHEATGQSVAIKYLNDRLLNDTGFRAAFRTEAQVLGGLATPYIAHLYEYVESPSGAAIVMELVPGVALSALLRQEGRTGPEAALVVLKGSLLALSAAHGAGVVHRDYKPDNVMITEDGSSRLIDFGIARRSGDGTHGDGTPPYMAPEQWTGGPADVATDVYAATVTFYECLTGERPFAGENLLELARQHIEDPVPVAPVPEPVRGLVLRGLAKSPAERPADAAAFLAELERVAGAAYGAGWEERGRRGLAALAALLPLLIPRSAAPPAGGTSLALTRLPEPPPGTVPVRDGTSLVVTLAALVVGVLVVAATLVPGWAGESGTRAEATTAPTQEDGGPGGGREGGSGDDGGEANDTAGDGGSSDGGEADGAEADGADGGADGGTTDGSADGSTAGRGGNGGPGGATTDGSGDSAGDNAGDSTGESGGAGDGNGGDTDGENEGSDEGANDGDSSATDPPPPPAELASLLITDMWTVWERGCECWVAYASVEQEVEGTGSVEIAANWYGIDSPTDPGVAYHYGGWVGGSDSYTVTFERLEDYCHYAFRLEVYPVNDPEGPSSSHWVEWGCPR